MAAAKDDLMVEMIPSSLCCGHMMHSECMRSFIASQEGTILENNRVLAPQQGELVCPLCRRLCNLPLLEWLPLASRFRRYRTLKETVAMQSNDETSMWIVESLAGVSLSHFLQFLELEAQPPLILTPQLETICTDSMRSLPR